MAEARLVPFRVEAGRGIMALDQTLLPHEERSIHLASVPELCEAIGSLRIRGAPMLGLAGLAGVAIAAETGDASLAELEAASATIAATRPTAADLGAGVRRAVRRARECSSATERRQALWQLADDAVREQYEIDGRIAAAGVSLLTGAGAVLTHCNTGALATGGRGTALAVVAEAFAMGHIQRCYATETRPLLQGARLTMWELDRLGIPGTLVPDTAAAALIATGLVGAVVTGADRIAANGDTANKIGTYGLALAAQAHGVPFFVAAPRSTFDVACPDGSAIPIEFRREDEVGGFGGQRWAPAGAGAFNPAFDVTPASLIGAIATDAGVLKPPYGRSIAAAFGVELSGPD